VATLRRQHGFSASEVAAVEVAAPPLIVRLVGRPPRPGMGASYARLCIAFAVAKVLLNGKLDLADFRGAALADPATHELARRVTLTSDGNPDPNALAPQRVTVRLSDGTEHRWSCETMLANPARPLTREQHLAKFRRCLDFAAVSLEPGAPGRLVEAIDRLEAMENVCVFARRL
jgi:2-methylcitrate dehydratase PrpD